MKKNFKISWMSQRLLPFRFAYRYFKRNNEFKEFISIIIFAIIEWNNKILQNQIILGSKLKLKKKHFYFFNQNRKEPTLSKNVFDNPQNKKMNKKLKIMKNWRSKKTVKGYEMGEVPETLKTGNRNLSTFFELGRGWLGVGFRG